MIDRNGNPEFTVNKEGKTKIVQNISGLIDTKHDTHTSAEFSLLIKQSSNGK